MQHVAESLEKEPQLLACIVVDPSAQQLSTEGLASFDYTVHTGKAICSFLEVVLPGSRCLPPGVLLPETLVL